MGDLMTESLMLVALGFFAAALIAIMAMRLVWRHAATVTARQLAPSKTPPQTIIYQPFAPHDSPSETRVATLEAALAKAEAALASAVTHQNTAAAQDRDAQEEISALRAQLDALTEDRDRIAKQLETEREHHLEWQTRLDGLAHNARTLIDLLDRVAAPPRTASPGTSIAAAPEQDAVTASLLQFNDNVKQRFGHMPPTPAEPLEPRAADRDVSTPKVEPTPPAKTPKPGHDKEKEQTLTARIQALQKGITSS